MKTVIAVILVIVVAVGGYVGYRYLSKPKPGEAPLVEGAIETNKGPVAPVVAQKPAATENKTPALTNRVRSTVKRTAATATKTAGEWKAKVDAILASGSTSQQKINDLRELLSKLEEAEAEQAVQELTTRVKDEGYAFIKPLAVDPNLPEPVRDEFMVDMMNRPNSIKIPLFLEIARNPDHPDRESAFDSLEIFTGMKYGADWNAWEKGIDTWLRENPDRVRQPQAPVQVN
jgi:hypothetical protein